MDDVVRVFSSWNEADEADAEYYASLTPTERVDILLELVAQYRSSLGPAGERFERVCRVVDLSED
jgi:hypothetical protein